VAHPEGEARPKGEPRQSAPRQNGREVGEKVWNYLCKLKKIEACVIWVGFSSGMMKNPTGVMKNLSKHDE
jgi:hypothetical protein